MNGIIDFLKPPGMSSNGAVVFIRGLLGGEKTGHAGTLDPGACGVLPICVGRATKVSSYLMDGKKEYIAEIAFGATTDTGDSYGQVIEKSDKTLPKPEDVRLVLDDFKGVYSQQTPAYSAVKHKGTKLYKLARSGKETPEIKRDVNIYEIEYLRSNSSKTHLIRVM